MKKIIAFSLIAFLNPTANASPVSLLGTDTDNGNKYYIINSPEPSRIGRGLLVWLLTENDRTSFVEKYYISCDGRSASNSINFELSIADNKNDRILSLTNTVLNSRGNLHTDIFFRVKIEQSGLPFQNKIISKVKEHCSNYKSEFKGDLYPFFQTEFNKERKSKISSLMSGRFNRVGDIVEGWVKTHSVIRSEATDYNGKALKNKYGEPVFHSKIDDIGFSIEKYSVKCKSSKISLVNFIEYDSNNQVKGTPFSSSQPSYDEAIPNTKGEEIMQTFCNLY